MPPPQEDLQTFRTHKPLWADGEQTQEDGPGATRLVPQQQQQQEPSASRISWPLTSFDNTIQNVACIAFLLGFLFAANIASLLVLSNYSPAPCPWTRLNLYAIQLLLFHLLEFLTTAIFNPTRVTVDCASPVFSPPTLPPLEKHALQAKTYKQPGLSFCSFSVE
jgi:protein-S-isoprenylcysteine O-methyltransferase